MLVLLLTALLCAQEPARIEELVREGALPRSELVRVQQEAADREDEAVLRRTLYGELSVEDLTEQQAGEMVAAARRRFERRQARLEEAKELADAGAISRLALTPAIEEVDRARRALDQALSRARLIRQLAEIVQVEAAVMASPETPAALIAPALYERYSGDGVFPSYSMGTIAQEFEKQFRKPLPVSANGDTALHRALGYDHRGRVDVALDPDQPEGLWLRGLLQKLRIPYYAFRSALSRRSTGPHIHIGPPSGAVRRGG